MAWHSWEFAAAACVAGLLAAWLLTLLVDRIDPPPGGP